MAVRIEADNLQENNPTTQPASVFISYASQDKGVADAVCQALDKGPCRVLDRAAQCGSGRRFGGPNCPGGKQLFPDGATTS